MKSKGYTDKVIQSIQDRVKVTGVFGLDDVLPDGFDKKKRSRGIQGMFRRLADRDIVVRVTRGRYKLLVANPVQAYRNAKGKHKPDKDQMTLPLDNALTMKAAMKENAMQNLQSSLNHQPSVKIVPYTSNTQLIIVGKRTFLAQEVALTPLNK